MSYDGVGNRTLLQDSLGGVTSSIYDVVNRLTSRQFGGTSQTPLRIDLGYTARNQLSTLTRYSNLGGTQTVGSSAYTYDANQRLTNLQHLNAKSALLANFTYTYDLADRLTVEQLNGTSTTYSYVCKRQATGARILCPLPQAAPKVTVAIKRRDMNVWSTVKEKWFVTLCAILCLTVCVAMGVFAALTKPSEVVLPAPDLIQEMRAQVLDHPDLKMPGVPEFSVPREYFSILLAGLTPAMTVGRYSGWRYDMFPKIAAITIWTNSGTRIQIAIHHTGKCPAGFTVDAEQCIRGGDHKPILITNQYEHYVSESVLIADVIRDIYKEQTTHKKSASLVRYIDDMARSRGEKPPERK
jgi:hypothetical protein